MLIAGIFFSGSISPPDEVAGTWLITGKDEAKVSIYKSGNKYYGKITWLQNPLTNGSPKLDKQNPDENRRNDPVIGLVIIKDFVWNADDKEYDKGTIYDPASGNSYSAYMQLQDPNKLKVRGYIGFSLIGRTEIWTRVQ